jgi:Cyclopropane fatty acid synthase and related methyltransferases
MVDYRTRIYKNYASRMQDAPFIFDEVDAKRWGRAYNTFLVRWLPENKNAAILEIACGGGNLLYFLKSKGYTNLQGVDISLEQVKLARQVIDSVAEEDALNYLNKYCDYFDLIVGLDIIEHFRKEEVISFIDACYKALLPKGRLILQTPNAESPWGTGVMHGDFTHEQAFTSNSLKKLLELCKFVEIESREAGPVVHGIFSLGRFIFWKIIRGILAFRCLVETGSIGSGIFTRVFLISGVKTE